eukprot:scaffold132_cov59-Cylindrotheca_fusiformis.AAC.4
MEGHSISFSWAVGSGKLLLGRLDTVYAAIGLGPSEVLLLKDRKFVSRCRKVSPKEKSRAVARFVNDSTEMLERNLQKFLDFDFHLLQYTRTAHAFT